MNSFPVTEGASDVRVRASSHCRLPPLHERRRQPEVRYQPRMLRGLERRVGEAENVGGMDGEQELGVLAEGDDTAAFRADLHLVAEEGAGGGGAQRHDEAGAQQVALQAEPGAAGLDLARV